MNAFTTLLPTHAMFAAAASATVQERGHSCPPPSHNPIRKYVIVTDFSGREHPMIFDRDIQHSTVIPHGFRAISAGFILSAPGTMKVLANMESTSLNLKPRPQDQEILQSFLSL